MSLRTERTPSKLWIFIRKFSSDSVSAARTLIKTQPSPAKGMQFFYFLAAGELQKGARCLIAKLLVSVTKNVTTPYLKVAFAISNQPQCDETNTEAGCAGGMAK